MVRLNVGGIDRLARIVVGAAIMGLTAASFGKWNLEVWWGVLSGIVGFALFVTGIMAWCPVYYVLKTGTHRHFFHTQKP